MALLRASTYITRLEGRGLTKEAIARALVRNSSLIGQIERGRKPGNNLRGPLSTLLRQVRRRGGRVPATPVAPPAIPHPVVAPSGRTTRAGQPARVRERKRAFTTTRGRGGFTLAAGREQSLINALRDAGAHAQVTLHVTFRRIRRYGSRENVAHHTVDIFPHGGYAAANIVAQAEEVGGLFPWIEAYVNDPTKFPHLEGARGVERVEMETLEPRAD